MKKLFFLLVVMSYFGVEAFAQYQSKEQNNAAFTVAMSDLTSKNVLLYTACYNVDRGTEYPSEAEFSNDESLIQLLTNEKDQGEKYHILLSRGVSIVNRPLYTNEEILSTDIQQKKDQDYVISLEDGIYHASGSGFNPSYDYTLEIVEKGEKSQNSHVNIMIGELSGLEVEGKTIQPSKAVIKYATGFSKVMMQKTNKLTRQITFYYPIDEERMIVQYYVLSYVNNLPPSFVGGAKLMVDKVKKSVLYGMNASEEL
ncbi:hypothetical protein [Flammeovirga sp. SubArs3]|uniref:hypothetical protein n=1 Tax=Flammeovirga sp. SubArs3 TaxID=2995316 RepID=UPI00248C21AD|nr:hypothetical protein [Flammeovirga sp. SubArs3]